MRLRWPWRWFRPADPDLPEATLWLIEQMRRLDDGGQIDPPWVQFPACDPADSGLRQGPADEWMHRVWWPYWHSLSKAQQESLAVAAGTPEPWRERLRAAQP